MKRKTTRALSLFLTAAMIGTSVPSVVLAEDFSQQPDVQWDSEAVDETANQESPVDISGNDAGSISETAGSETGDDFTSDAAEEPDEEIPAQEEPGQNDVVGEISGEPEELTAPETEELAPAEENEEADQLEESEGLVSAGESSAAEIIASGNCGETSDRYTGRFGAINEDGSNIEDTAKWTLDSQGTLTITGSGKTTCYRVDYYEELDTNDLELKKAQPWAAYDDQIRKVVIEEGITEIGNFNFMKCKNLETVQLPNTLKKIWSRAFWKCESLKEITIPDSVDVIADHAFASCEKLKTVQLSKSLTGLAEAVFYNTGLTKIVIPEGVKSIDAHAFYWCRQLKEVILPKTLQIIEYEAFASCSSLTAVTLPDSLETLDQEAFYSCGNLKTVKFGKNLKEIGVCAFENCTSLDNIVLPNSLKTIRERAFQSCAALTSVKFGDNITKIEKQAFSSCYMIKELILPKNLKELGESAFSSTAFCKRFVVYKNLQKLGKYALGSLGGNAVHGGSFNGTFYPATVDKVDFYYEGTRAQWEKLSKDAVIGDYDCSGSWPRVPYYHRDHCVRFHYGTTKYQNESCKITFNKNAKNATLKTTSKQVKTNSKYGTLPTPSRSGYYFTGWYTKASGGSKVTASTVFKQTKNQTLYAHWAKADLSKATVTLSKSSFTWNGKAQTPSVTVKFQGAVLKKGTHYTVTCSNNKEPGTAVLTISGKGIFGKTKKTVKFTITKAAQTISAKDMICKPSRKGSTVTLNASVKNSDGTKLHYYSNSKAVQVLNKDKSKLKLAGVGIAVITIKADETKHYKAASRKIKVIQQGNQSIELKQQSFMKYDKTKGVYVLSKELFNQALQISVKGKASYTCSVENGAKTSAWIDKNQRLTASGNGIFTLKISTKTSPDRLYPAASKKFYISVKGIANSAASKWNYRVDSDGKITLLKYTGTETTVNVPDTITLDSKKFSVKAIGESAFAGTKVKKVSISDKYMKSIGKNAFKNCKSLQEIRLGTGITSIGAGAFSGCSALKTIAFPDGLKVIETELLKGCSALSGEIYLPKALTTIRKNAFEGCGRISELMVFTFLSSVESNAFKDCNSLQKVYFSGARVRWNGIKFDAGNEKLTGAQIICNAGGGNTAYEVNDISTTDLMEKYPEYLSNAGYDKILNDLEDDVFSIMSNHTGTEEALAAIKTQMQSGYTETLKSLMFWATGNSFEEDKLKRSLALELISETSDYLPTGDESNSAMLDSLKSVYKTLKDIKGKGDQIFGGIYNDDEKFDKLAGELAEALGEKKSDVKDALRRLGEKKAMPLKPGQTEPEMRSEWDNISDKFKAVGIAFDAADYLEDFCTLVIVGRDVLDRIAYRLPETSGLYQGVALLRSYLQQHVGTILSDYVGDEVTDFMVEAGKKALTGVVDDMIRKIGTSNFKASFCLYISNMFYKSVSLMMDCPTISDYNKAWYSLSNTMVLHTQVKNMRAQLVYEKNRNSVAKNLEADYELMTRLYLNCLKKTGGYVAKTMSDPYILNAKFARFDSSLTYENHILTCKWGLIDSGVLG